jgi:hypothetical protein
MPQSISRETKNSQVSEQVIALRRDIEDEKSARRKWTIRRAEIDKEMEHLRKSGLAGVRLKGKRPGDRPSGEDTASFATSAVEGVQTNNLVRPLEAGAQDDIHGSQDDNLGSGTHRELVRL